MVHAPVAVVVLLLLGERRDASIIFHCIDTLFISSGSFPEYPFWSPFLYRFLAMIAWTRFSVRQFGSCVDTMTVRLRRSG